MKYHQKILLPAMVLPLTVSLFLACVGESPTVTPADITTGGGSISTGYYYPEVVNVYPSDGSTGNPVTTNYVIVFNIPIDTATLSANISVSSSSLGALSEGIHYTIGTGPSPVTVVTITFIGAMNPIPNNDTISITMGAGIRDQAQNVNLNNPGTYTFSVGSAPDTTAPATVAGTNSPTGGGISRTAPGISIQFTEAIDVSTLNSETFYVETGSVKVPSTMSYNGLTNTASLTPMEPLAKGTSYTVHVTTGVKDLSGNSLPADVTWNFTTVNTEIDPEPGAPTITSGINIDAVTDTTADVSWITSEATNYTLSYGRNNDATGTTVNDLLTYTSLHSLNLAGLTAGKRYYAQVDYSDIGGNAGITSSIAEFNTLTDESPNTVDDGADNQHTAKWIINAYGVAASGAFVFWAVESSGSRHLYAQRISSAGAPLWAAGGLAIANNAGISYYYFNAAEDETGGFVVLYSIGGNGIYAKRFDSSGTIVNWGASSDETTDPGITIDAAGTNPSAVPVYTGIVNVKTTGTATHGSMSLPNWFFEDDANLLTLVADGDIVYDTDNMEGTTIDINSIVPDYRHIIGQDSVQAVSKAAAENYIIADGTTSNSFNAADHDMNVNPDYLNGTNKVYTPHGYSLPVWLGAGDIITLGTDYKRITAINAISVASTLTGTATGYLLNSLYDTAATFTATVSVNDLVINTDDSLHATVSAVIDDHTLTLSADIFDGTENYAIYHNYCTTHTSVEPFYEFVLDGNLNATDGANITLYDYTGISGTSDIPPTNPLFDDAADFTAAGVANGDVALNFTDKLLATVTTATYTLTACALDLDTDIFTDADGYSIIRFINANTDASHIITLGTATSYTASHLIDSSNTFATVHAGDIAYNLSDNTYAMVTAVAANNLTLTRDIFDNGNERYLIISRRGVLYVWQAAGPLVRGQILTIEGGSAPVTLRPAWTIANGSNPTAISDGMGSALVVYNNTATPSQVVVQKLDGTGTSAWGPVEIDTQNASAETIHIVQSDTAGGVIVLYSLGGNMRVQRIDATGARQWGANGQALGNPAAPTQVDMAYVGGNDVIVVANISGDIWAVRVGTTSWAGYYVSNATDTQQNPKIFLNGADTIIVWEDDRFLSFAGYAIFGMKINASTGVRDAGWYADTTSSDLNGIAFILNDYNEYWGNIALVPYNNGAGALLLWEDYRTPGEGINIYYRDITSFAP